MSDSITWHAFFIDQIEPRLTLIQSVNLVSENFADTFFWFTGASKACSET